MLRNVKRIVSIMLFSAFTIAMLTSCSAISVKNNDPVVLKVGTVKYTFKDYAELFNNELYSYVYSGGEKEYNKDYESQSSTERLRVFQDYVYDKLIEQGIKDYIIETEKLADKLTDEDNKAIDELVTEAIESEASSKESDVSESDTTIEEMKTATKDAGKEPTTEEIDALPTSVEETIEAAVAAKMAVATEDDTDTTESADVQTSEETKDPEDTDDPDAQTPGTDTTASDETETQAVSMTREEAEKAVAEENGFDTFEEYKQSVADKAEFDLYFGYYKKIKALELYEESYEKDHDGEKLEDHKKELRETKTTEYLRDTKVADFLAGDYKASDSDIKKYFDEQMKKYEDMEASEYYNYLDGALKEEDGKVWLIKDGYYYVKHVLLNKVEDDTAESGEVKVDPEAQKAVENEIEKINAMTDEDEALKAFDALMEKYGEDPGMQSEPAKTTGYLMGEGNSMVEEFSKASDELFKAGKIGAVSGAVKSSYGIHYIQLVKKLDAKKITLDEVKDEIADTVTEQKVSEIVSDKLAEYRNDVKITEYRDRIRSLGGDYASMYFGDTNG